MGFAGVFVTVWLANWFFKADSELAGLLVGNTLQSMGHVVAAGFSINNEVGQTAVLVKMYRIVMLIPVLLLLIVFWGKQVKKEPSKSERIHWLKLIPVFIWVFLLLCLLATMAWIPQTWVEIMTMTSRWLFLLAMAAIGLNIELKHIYQTGGRILLLGLLVFSAQLIFSSWILLNI